MGPPIKLGKGELFSKLIIDFGKKGVGTEEKRRREGKKGHLTSSICQCPMRHSGFKMVVRNDIDGANTMCQTPG